MAKNVSHNVEALEMDITTITNKNGIVKRRYVDNRSGQMVLRVDEHDYCERIDKKVLEDIRNNKCKPYFSGETKVDAIIISDYCKGFLEEDDFLFKKGMEWGRPDFDQLVMYMSDAVKRNLKIMDHFHTKRLVSKEFVLQEFVTYMV